jgi:hypothetical protein
MTKVILIAVAYCTACLLIIGFCRLMASDGPKDYHGVPCTISQEQECH